MTLISADDTFEFVTSSDLTQAEGLPHPKYYIPHDLVVIHCEQTLFRVSQSQLAKYAGYFARQFASHTDISSGPTTTNDDDRVRILDPPMKEFEVLLDMIYAAELGFVLDDTEADIWLRRLAVANRFDAKLFQDMALQRLATCDDPYTHIVAARRFDLPNWLWSAYIAAILREAPPTRREIMMLSGNPNDVFIITSIREKTQSERKQKSIRTEMRVRQLLNGDPYEVREPSTSDLPPPPSGYRIRIEPGEPLPRKIPGGIPIEEGDGVGRYIGSAILDNGEIIPGKVVEESGIMSYAAWGREHTAARFYILPFDPVRMEWIEVTGGNWPTNRKAVHGGFEDHTKSELCHCYGEVEGRKVLGKTFLNGSAWLSHNGWEHRVDTYYVLMWKEG